MRAVTAIHGESDHYSYSSGTAEVPIPGTDGIGTITSYLDGLLEWQRDYENGVKSITGQTIPVPLLISQMHLWTDVPRSGANVPITNVQVTGADTVTLTLASAAPGGRLRYAFTAPAASCPGPQAGVRGNLRDSDATASLHGHEIFNWGVTFEEPAL